MSEEPKKENNPDSPEETPEENKASIANNRNFLFEMALADAEATPMVDLEAPSINSNYRNKGEALRKSLKNLKPWIGYLNSDVKSFAEDNILRAEIYLSTFKTEEKE